MKMKNVVTVAFVVIVIALFLCPVLVTAAEVSATPFIKAEYYKGEGSNALTSQRFASNPRIYYRSEHAFQMGREWAERVIDSSLTDAEFIALLQSDRVRTMLCNGKVTTGGLLPQDYHWFERQCYSKEEILQVEVGGRWVDLLSLACLNPIEDKTPLPETAQTSEGDKNPPARKCRWVTENETWHESGPVFVRSPMIVAGCNGLVVVEGGAYQMPSHQNKSTKLRRVCSE